MALMPLTLILGLTGCGSGKDGGDDGDDEIPAEITTDPASGSIHDAAWTVASAVFEDGADGRLHMELSDVAAMATCDHFAKIGLDARKVLGSFAAAAGTYEFAFPGEAALTIAFQDADGVSQNLISPGRVIVETLDETHVAGRIYVRFDAGNVVTGAFTGQRCPATP
jgi:hypothetical protein